MTISGYCKRGFSPLPSARMRAFKQAEGVGREIHQREKEYLHAGKNDRSVGEESRVGFVAEAQNEAVSGEQERPEQQRAFLTGP